MSDKTVRQLAEVVGIPLERLLEQLKEAGLSASAPDDVIQEDEKVKLLAHLRKRHGKTDAEVDAAPRRVTLKRRKVSELKQSSAPGTSAKTISIEVRKKKTYIKRSEVAGTEEQKELEEAKKALEEQQRIAAEEEARRLEAIRKLQKRGLKRQRKGFRRSKSSLPRNLNKRLRKKSRFLKLRNWLKWRKKLKKRLL